LAGGAEKDNPAFTVWPSCPKKEPIINRTMRTSSLPYITQVGMIFIPGRFIHFPAD